MSDTAKHPKGLSYLFFTEMWERFGYYLMLGIFFLYMTDNQKGGMELDNKEAADIFGTFIALVFLTPFIGGLLADRLLGYRVSIYIGGAMMGLGYMALAIPGDTAFILALLLIIIGNGFFKPNISTLLGNLYNDEQYKANKDSGYNIFYMGINIGAFVCNFFAAYLRNNYGWGYAFFAAGIGMFIGLIIFAMGQKHIKHADVLKPTMANDMSLMRILMVVIVPSVLAGIAGWVLIPGNIFGSDSTDAFLFGALPVTIFYISLWVNAQKEDKNAIAALLAIFGVVIIFWAIFKQNGTALTTWAEHYTDRALNESVVPVVQPLGMVQTIPSDSAMYPIMDHHFRTSKDTSGTTIKALLPHPYLINTPQSEWPQAGKPMNLISTELFQSINPFFVVILTPVVVGFFGFLRKRKREPSTPAKIGWGLFITAVSTLVMVAAVWVSSNGEIKASAGWLIGAYGVITIGELFLSPMGLSLVSKLSPPRLTALMMGGWFLSTSIGNKLSGVLAGLWDGYESKEYFFLVNCVGALIAALAIFAMVKWLRNIVDAKMNG
jgi:POT family proton-dependent oligopeptide transporter